MITYRLAREEDVPAILAIYAPYIRETTYTFEYDVPSEAAFLARFRGVTARFPWLVCQDEHGDVLGYAYGSLDRERAAYGWNADLAVYLRQDARGRGLGEALYARLCPLLFACGYRTLYAVVTGENEGSMRFHRRLGFAETARFPQTGYKHGRWLDTVWYQKTCGDFPADPTPPRSFWELDPASVEQVLQQ